MSDRITASEAVYGFAGWLTSRYTRTVMSAVDDASDVAALCKEFCEANGLADPRDNWSAYLVHPGSGCPPDCFHALPVESADVPRVQVVDLGEVAKKLKP